MVKKSYEVIFNAFGELVDIFNEDLVNYVSKLYKIKYSE